MVSTAMARHGPLGGARLGSGNGPYALGSGAKAWHANERTATARSSSVVAFQRNGSEVLSPAMARPGSALTGVGTARQSHGTALTGFGIGSVARQGHGFALTGFG